MADLPYWFTAEDKTNPVFCRACKQHIPRAAYVSGQGLCQSCLSRMGSKPGANAMPTIAGVSAPAPGVKSVSGGSSIVPSGDSSPAKTQAPRRPVTGITAAVIILLAGAAIAVARIVLHF